MHVGRVECVQGSVGEQFVLQNVRLEVLPRHLRGYL